MNYINIKQIMDKLTRHPLLQDIPFETVIDYSVEFIRLLGVPASFIDKTKEISIKDYRGELPCDFYEMIQVRTSNEEKHTFRYTTDTFHLSDNKALMSDFTYKLQGNCIFTFPLENGFIEISYRAFPMDDEGYPLIPDNSTYSRALEAYIKKEWIGIQFDLGKIPQQVMARADQEYAWKVGQAQTDLIRPSIDQMQSISNMWNTLIPRDAHRHGFIYEGTQEHIRTH